MNDEQTLGTTTRSNFLYLSKRAKGKKITVDNDETKREGPPKMPSRGGVMLCSCCTRTRLLMSENKEKGIRAESEDPRTEELQTVGITFVSSQFIRS